jgi:hypothetical protein
MTLLISAVTESPTINPEPLKASCTNCIHGDYWSDTSPALYTSGFDCAYPNIGSKSTQHPEIVQDDGDIATSCPKYQPVN